MGLFDNFKKVDVRSLENPNAPVSAEWKSLARAIFCKQTD